MPDVSIARPLRLSAEAARPAAERVIAYGVSGFLAIHFTDSRFPALLVILFPTLAVLLILPVTLSAAARYRGGIPLALIALAAAISSILLSLANSSTHRIGGSDMVLKALLIAGIGICVVTLLWARSVIGIPGVALSYGIGSLVSVGLSGVDPTNAWKFSLPVPVVLIVLGVPAIARARWVQVAVLVLLAGVSGVLDSRSLAGTLLIAAALLLTRRRPGSFTSGWIVAVQIALIGIAGFFLIQTALLGGLLGASSQARTQLQIETAGNIITGGRPEIAASTALITAQPTGYGSGTIPSYHDIEIAKEAMIRIGYDPNNGYVDKYLFGSSFEVHSVIGDLWLQGGIIGMLFALAILICVVGGMASDLAHGTAVAVSLFLGVRTVWDLCFSPILSTYFTISLCLALLLPLGLVSSVRPRRLGPATRIGLGVRGTASSRNA